jgi:dipeptidyl aminopeptidase/acylaminoacyl peptidase
MNAKDFSRWGVSCWLTVLIILVEVSTLSGFASVGLAAGKPTLQDKKEEKKDEKKDEKKEEKKGLPLKSDRKIEFTTDEGTWISLDVSPDGKTIAFELLGDIYTLPIEGGQAKLISGGMAFDSQPKFSPDGKWIAFISDREGSENIWAIHPDGTEVKQVSKDPNAEFSSPSWTPDGNYVYVSKASFGINTFELAFTRRKISLLRAAPGRLCVQCAISSLADCPARPQDRR